jgi:hypothetical protein
VQSEDVDGWIGAPVALGLPFCVSCEWPGSSVKGWAPVSRASGGSSCTVPVPRAMRRMGSERAPADNDNKHRVRGRDGRLEESAEGVAEDGMGSYTRRKVEWHACPSGYWHK